MGKLTAKQTAKYSDMLETAIVGMDATFPEKSFKFAYENSLRMFNECISVLGREDIISVFNSCREDLNLSRNTLKILSRVEGE